MASEEKLIKDAQYRKGLSIAFFNATNAAIEIVKLKFKDYPNLGNEVGEDKLVQDDLIFWRNWLLSEHSKYYSEVIASVGKPYDASKTIENLKKAASVEELKKMFMMMSPDEQHDGDIRKVVAELKKTLK